MLPADDLSLDERLLPWPDEHRTSALTTLTLRLMDLGTPVAVLGATLRPNPSPA